MHFLGYTGWETNGVYEEFCYESQEKDLSIIYLIQYTVQKTINVRTYRASNTGRKCHNICFPDLREM